MFSRDECRTQNLPVLLLTSHGDQPTTPVNLSLIFSIKTPRTNQNSAKPMAWKLQVKQTSADSTVRIYCAVSVGQNQVQIRNPDTRKPSRLKISNFDGQTPYSKPGQNPDSAFRRRLILNTKSSFYSTFEISDAQNICIKEFKIFFFLRSSHFSLSALVSSEI